MKTNKFIAIFAVIILVSMIFVYAKPGNPTPPPTNPLTLDHSGSQIVAGTQNGVVKIWSYNGQSYSQSWTNTFSGVIQGVAIGDVDNDTYDELVVVKKYFTGSGKNKVVHPEVQIFEDGNTNTPNRVYDLAPNGETYVWYIRLGDANNDGTLEIAIAGNKYVFILDDNGNSITKLWQSENLISEQPFSIDIGDADNDGQNELLYAGLSGKKFGVYNYLGNNNWGNKVYSSPVEGALDRAFVVDVDGDGDNEIIGGGNYQKLTVWEEINDEYYISYQSTSLGGFTQGISAGDYDNDGVMEISVGTAGALNNAYVFENVNTSYYSQVYQNPSSMVTDIYSGDSDNDGVDEFVLVAGDGLYVYGYASGYSNIYFDSLDQISSVSIG